MPSFPSSQSLTLEATSPLPPAPARTPTLHVHEKAGSNRSIPQPQRITNAEPVAASSSLHPTRTPCWDSQAFDRQLNDVRSAGDYRAISAQHGYLPSSFEYEALHDAAQQAARAAIRDGMSCRDAATRFHVSSNPDDVDALMLFAARELASRATSTGA